MDLIEQVEEALSKAWEASGKPPTMATMSRITLNKLAGDLIVEGSPYGPEQITGIETAYGKVSISLDDRCPTDIIYFHDAEA